VFQHLAILDNYNRALSAKMVELEKALTYTIMAQQHGQQSYAHHMNPVHDHHNQHRAPPTTTSNNTTQEPEKKKIMLFGKVVDPQ
jgi:hypothetical protein